MIDSRSITDTYILENTRIIDEGRGNISYEMDLPGRDDPLTTDPFPSNSQGMAIRWCETVRAQMSVDEQLAEEKRDIEKRQGRSRSAPIVDAENMRPRTARGESSYPDDPESFIKRQCDLAARELSEATKILLLTQERHVRAQDALIKWEKIAESAGIALTEETEDAQITKSPHKAGSGGDT